MRSLLSILVTCALVGSACSSNDDEPDAAPDTAAPGEATTSAPGTSATTEQPDSSTPDTTPPSSVPGATAWEQLQYLSADPDTTDTDVHLAELAALVGPIPGAPTLIDDGTIFPSLTHTLDALEIDETLTDEQRRAIDRRLDEVFDESEIVESFLLYPDEPTDPGDDPADTSGDDLDGGSNGDDGPEGLLARSGPTEDSLPVDDSVRTAVASVANDLRRTLGGPPLKIWVERYPSGALRRGAAAENVTLGTDAPRRAELLDDGIDADCILRFTDGFPTVSDLLGVFVHEIVHCWQYTHIGLDLDRMIAMPLWIKEGSAAYLGDTIGGITRFNASWWAAYLGGRVDGTGAWSLYAGLYDAIGFWSRLAESGDPVAAITAALDAGNNNGRAYDAAIASVASTRDALASGATQRADLGPAWTATGPGMPSTGRPTAAETVVRSAPFHTTADAGTQRAHEVDVHPIDGADGTVMTIRTVGWGMVHVGDADVGFAETDGVDRWCIGECMCPDDAPAFPASRTLPAGDQTVIASLAGRATEASWVTIDVERFDPDDADHCDDEPDPEPPTEGGGSGPIIATWKAQPASVATMYEQASAPDDGSTPLFDIPEASGDVLLTFASGGTGTLVYRDVMLFPTDLPPITINGAGTFRWLPTPTGVTIDGVAFEFAVTSEAFGGSALTITDDDVPATGTTDLSASAIADSLVITSTNGSAGKVYFPKAWDRVD